MTLTLSLRIACSRILNRLGYATLTVDPTNATHNAVLYTAREAGAGGEDISVEYATPAAQATTTVAVVGDAITVTPGTKARMEVSGVSTAAVNGVLLLTPLSYSGSPTYTNDGLNYTGEGTQTAVVKYAGVWRVLRWESDALVYESILTSGAASPDGLTFPAPAVGTGTPTVTAGVSSAAQVIAAVNASTPAAALVTASESGASTGPVAAVAAANLTLIPANALTLDGIALTLDGATLTLD